MRKEVLDQVIQEFGLLGEQAERRVGAADDLDDVGRAGGLGVEGGVGGLEG